MDLDGLNTLYNHNYAFRYAYYHLVETFHNVCVYYVAVTGRKRTLFHCM